MATIISKEHRENLTAGSKEQEGIDLAKLNELAIKSPKKESEDSIIFGDISNLGYGRALTPIDLVRLVKVNEYQVVESEVAVEAFRVRDHWPVSFRCMVVCLAMKPFKYNGRLSVLAVSRSPRLQNWPIFTYPADVKLLPDTVMVCREPDFTT